MVVKLVRLSAAPAAMRPEREREQSSGGNRRRGSSKPCAEGLHCSEHMAAAAVHAWVFSFEEEVNGRTNEGGGLDHYKSSRMTNHAMPCWLS